jgi:hypothetical protein
MDGTSYDGFFSLRDPPMRPMLRRVVAFVVAACAMVLLGSAAHSLFVQRAWSGAAGHAFGTAPAGIPFADRISWVAHDLIGMFVPYSIVTSIALLIAFLIAGALARFTRFTRFRVIVFGVAGAAALFALFTILRSVLGTVGIFGARGPAGLAAQMVVGAVAGVLFAQLTSTSPRKSFRIGTSGRRLG